MNLEIYYVSHCKQETLVQLISRGYAHYLTVMVNVGLQLLSEY